MFDSGFNVIYTISFINVEVSHGNPPFLVMMKQVIFCHRNTS